MLEVFRDIEIAMVCGPEIHSFTGSRFTLCFPMNDGCLSTGSGQQLQFRKSEAVLLYPETEVFLQAVAAVCISFPRDVLSELPFSEEDRSAVVSLLSLKQQQKDCFLYFRALPDSMIQQVFHLLNEYDEKQPFYASVLSVELAALLLRLCRHVWRVVSLRNTAETGTVRSMLNYLFMHYRDASLEEMAAAFNYHPNTAAALLKKSTGKTFSMLLLEIRMVRVAEGLRSGLSVTEAAEACGYKNMSNFYRRFKQYYGMTPTDYLQTPENQPK